MILYEAFFVICSSHINLFFFVVAKYYTTLNLFFVVRLSHYNKAIRYKFVSAGRTLVQFADGSHDGKARRVYRISGPSQAGRAETRAGIQIGGRLRMPAGISQSVRQLPDPRAR